MEYNTPCSHAIATILFIREDPLDYFTWFDLWHTQKKKTYSYTLTPVTIDDLECDKSIQPPLKVKKSGRPRKQRIRNSAREAKEQRCCGTCHKFGHYKNNCPNQPFEKHGKAQRARDNDIDEVDNEVSYDEESDFEPPVNALQDEVEESSDSGLSTPSDDNSDLSHSLYALDSSDNENMKARSIARVAALAEQKKKQRVLNTQKARQKDQPTASSSKLQATSKSRSASTSRKSSTKQVSKVIP